MFCDCLLLAASCSTITLVFAEAEATDWIPSTLAAQQDIKLQRPHVERTDRYDADTTETNLNRIDRE